MSCCGGNCGCGATCNCGPGCTGCKMYPSLGEEKITSTQAPILGVSPTKVEFEGVVMAEAGNACTCNPCKCDPCTCK